MTLKNFKETNIMKILVKLLTAALLAAGISQVAISAVLYQKNMEFRRGEMPSKVCRGQTFSVDFYAQFVKPSTGQTIESSWLGFWNHSFQTGKPFSNPGIEIVTFTPHVGSTFQIGLGGLGSGLNFLGEYLQLQQVKSFKGTFKRVTHEATEFHFITGDGDYGKSIAKWSFKLPATNCSVSNLISSPFDRKK